MTTSLTTGRPTTLIIRFTLPLLAGNLFQQLYIIADTLIVGRTLGVEALAAIGCTGSTTWLIIGFTFGLTNGLAIPTAQRFGAGDAAGVRRSFTNGAILAAAVAGVLTCLTAPVARTALALLDTPPEILDDAAGFAVVILLGLPANVGFNHVCSTMRAIGDSRTPFYICAATTTTNIVLVYWFVLGLGLGVPGAGLATVASQCLWGVIGALLLWRRVPVMRLTRADWRLDPDTLRELSRIGFPMALQMTITALGGLALQPALNSFGTEAVAAYAAAGKVDAIAVAPFMSLGVTISTFAAQNLGAGEFGRVLRGVRDGVRLAVGFALVIGLVLMASGPAMIGVFVSDASEQVVALGQRYLVVNCSLYALLGAMLVWRSALQGLGQSLVPTIAGFGELVARVAAAFLLAAPFGFTGVCLANPLAWLLSAIPLVLAWQVKRRWLEDRAAALAV